MKDLNSNVLKIMLILLNLAYSGSSMDRKKLHDIEWNNADEKFSILGEIEIRSDTMIGIAESYLRKKPNNIDEIINILENNSIYKSKVLINWIAVDGIKFQSFFNYMQLIENLRICLITFISQK